jgi:hypothetical protein
MIAPHQEIALRCYDENECKSWIAGRGLILPTKELLQLSVRTKDFRTYPLCHFIARTLSYNDDVLLWVTEWGIWRSSENWHLFEKLRLSYGESRRLDEAPGHLFREYEMSDLATLLQVAIDNGWGGYVMAAMSPVNIFFSHDEFIDFYAEDPSLLDDVREWIKPIS